MPGDFVANQTLSMCSVNEEFVEAPTPRQSFIAASGAKLI